MIHMVWLRKKEDLSGAVRAGANVAGARPQQARAASIRLTDGISGSKWVPTCVGITGPPNTPLKYTWVFRPL